MVALSCMGNLLFVQSSGAFSSLSRSLQTLLCHCWGLRAVRGLLLPGRDFLYGGILCLSSTVVWTVLVHINYFISSFFNLEKVVTEWIREWFMHTLHRCTIYYQCKKQSVWISGSQSGVQGSLKVFYGVPQQKGKPFIFTIFPSKCNTVYDYFGLWFHKLSVIKHVKAKLLSKGGLFYVYFGVLDVKTIENHWASSLLCSNNHPSFLFLQAIGVVSSLVRSAKRSQSRGNVFTLAELVSYIRHQMISGQHREARIENHGEGKVRKDCSVHKKTKMLSELQN